MTVAYRISSSASQINNQGNYLEVEPIHDPDCPRASFCVSDGDPEAHLSPVVELSIDEVRELREALAKLEKDLEASDTGE